METFFDGELVIEGTGAMYDAPTGWASNFESQIQKVVIKDGVTSICSSAFSNCTNLTSVTIPDSVTSIGTMAFYGCTSLTDVYYAGTEEQWKAITIGESNARLTDANIKYNS